MTNTKQANLLEKTSLKMGTLEVRLAKDAKDVKAAQALRYRVFYEEMGAKPIEDMAKTKRDHDSFDNICDHLLVIDHAKGSGETSVVGTYRLIRRAAADKHGSFYSADEFNIDQLLHYQGEILEVGRSCVEKEYRTRAVMQLLWRAIAAYVFHYNIEILFGCASLHGTDPKKLALPLSYLYYHHLAPPALRPVALPHRYVDMRLMNPDEIDPRAALDELPILIKGYLRLGGFVGDGAVIDEQFNTTDVSVIVKTDLVTEKYLKHYERLKEDVEK